MDYLCSIIGFVIVYEFWFQIDQVVVIVYIFFPRGNKILIFFGITIILSFFSLLHEYKKEMMEKKSTHNLKWIANGKINEAICVLLYFLGLIVVK